MEKPKKEAMVKDYTTLEGQLKMLRALLLATTLLLAVFSIRCHSRYLELNEKYHLLAESDRLLFESNQLLLESDRLILEQQKLILEQQRLIRETFGIVKPVPEEIPLSP